MAPMVWFHGSTHRLEAGAVLRPGAASANYAATEGADVVFVTDRVGEAWDWAGFAAEMNSADTCFVYEVAPAGDPVPVEAPERHCDGSPYSEFTCAAATVLAVHAAEPACV